MKKYMRLLVSELSHMLRKKSFWLVFLIIQVYCSGLYLYQTYGFISGKLDIASSGTAIFAGGRAAPDKWKDIFFSVVPMLVALPCIIDYYQDMSQHKPIVYTLSKVKKTTYYFAKASFVFLQNFILFFVPYALNLLISCLSFKESYLSFYGTIGTTDYCSSVYSVDMPFQSLYCTNPILYCFLYCIALGVFAGLLGLFSYALSIWLKKSSVLALLGPFLIFYVFEQNRSLLKGFSLYEALQPLRYWGEGYGHIMLYIALGVSAVSGILIFVKAVGKKQII